MLISDILYIFVNSIYFTLAAFVAWYIPGDVILWSFRLRPAVRIPLNIVVGMVGFVLVGYMSALLMFRQCTYGYVSIFFLYWIWQRRRMELTHVLTLIRRVANYRAYDPVLLVIVGVGVILQLLSVSLNGIQSRDAFYFCCGGPDALFHTALTSELVSTFPPMEPGVDGVALRNYHYFTNLLVADMVRVFRLPLIPTLWTYFTIGMTLLLVATAVAFSTYFQLGKVYRRWFIFFLLFSGDIVYILYWIYGVGLRFDNGFLNSAVSLWFSPSRYVSVIIFIALLVLLGQWMKKGVVKNVLLVACLLGTLVGIKIYTFIFAFTGLILLLMYYLLKKQYFRLWVLAPLSLLISVIYLPTNSSAGGFIFSGLWRIENFIAQQPPPISDLELRRLTYKAHRNYLRLLQYALIYFLFYFTFVFGTLLSALFQTKKSLSKLPIELHIFLLGGFASSIAFGLFFVQKTGNANSVQFLIFVQIFASIYAALALTEILGIIRLAIFRNLLIIMIVLLTIPRVLYESSITIRHISGREGLVIDQSLNEGLTFLRNFPSHTGSIAVFSGADYRKERCMHIAFLTGRRLFYCDDGAPSDRGVNVEKRKEINQRLFASSDPDEVNRLIMQNNIEYLFVYVDNPMRVNITKTPLIEIFKNTAVIIYQFPEVDRDR